VSGGLSIDRNAELRSMTSLIKPEGRLGKLGGELRISYNPKLSACQPDALWAVLSAEGWLRFYEHVDNLFCKSCGGVGRLVCQ
jgi:hypothetical protein